MGTMHSLSRTREYSSAKPVRCSSRRMSAGSAAAMWRLDSFFCRWHALAPARQDAAIVLGNPVRAMALAIATNWACLSCDLSAVSQQYYPLDAHDSTLQLTQVLFPTPRVLCPPSRLSWSHHGVPTGKEYEYPSPGTRMKC